MAFVLLFLAIIIFGYVYITDAQRVRQMASAYLSELLGGEVTIGRANLSIFEGLRLDDVTLRVDRKNEADSNLFHARTFLLRYRPTELLAGRLSATQIIAIDPVVMLVEDADSHRWNYQRLWQGHGPPKHSSGGGKPLVLPQIILRDAEVAYKELHNGKTVSVGWYSLEGSLNPNVDEPDRYDFELQSRGRESLGPSVNGVIRTQGGISVAHMQNFTFGPDIKTMLLAEPRQWCEMHQLQGRIDVPEMVYDPNPGGSGPIFHAQLVLSDVEMVIHPQEWMSAEQNDRIKLFHEVLETAESRKWISSNTAYILRGLSTPQPVRFSQVSGDMLFTQSGILLKGITGKVENNWFNVDGQLAGYSPDAPAHLIVSSVTGHDLDIPDIPPDYLGSFPKEAQDVIEHLHPRGTCALRVDIQRRDRKTVVNGQIDVKDGQFCFADFPYPISRVQGQIFVGNDPIAHMDGVRIFNLEGHGDRGGVNADATVTINGFIGPLVGVAGVSMDVNATNVTGDAAVRKALPADASRALQLFDPDGHGEYPKFHGDFAAHVQREPGPHKPVYVSTNITLDDGEGRLIAFPYPLKLSSGRVEVREGYLNIIGAQMQHGKGTIGVDGIVRWRSNIAPSTQPTGPDLRIVARDVPIDDDFKNALPPAARAWAENGGLSGTLNMDGHVFPAAGTKDVGYTFDGTLSDGALQSGEGEAAMSNMAAVLHLTPTRLEIDNLTGNRGPSALKAQVLLDFAGAQPKIMLTGAASNLQLNQSLYQMLPQSARAAWDSVKPHGDVDATLELTQTVGAAPERLELHITPRELSVKPAPLPYRLDHLKGEVFISPNDVVLRDLTAEHGAARISLGGQGHLGHQPSWDMHITADQLAVDSDLLAAVPDSVGSVLSGMHVQGRVGLDLSKLTYWPSGQAASLGADDPKPDVDFAAKINLLGDSLDVGLTATGVKGSLDLAGLVRGGDLHRLAGQCQIDSMQLADRPASNFQFALAKNSNDPEIDVSHLTGRFADGDLAGQGDYIFPANAPSRYDLNMVLRDADVRQITTSSAAADIQGRLTASIQLGGMWNQPASRRGHGDVLVRGDRLYNIPVMFGLMQITNLQLPLNSPFNQITTRYALEGQKVLFEKIELKSNDVAMTGSGEVDFARRTVSLWLATNNPALLALPVIGPLLGGANQELLKVHIKGTIDQPKVSASTFDTVTTTVDEVFR